MIVNRDFVSRFSLLRLPSFCPFSRRSLTVTGSSYERRSVLIAVEIYTLECLHSRVPVLSRISVFSGTLIREYINSWIAEFASTLVLEH